MAHLLIEYLYLTVEAVILESKQNIVNLGFPPLIASFFFERFGNKAFLLAKWYKEARNYRNLPDDVWFSKSDPGNMFDRPRHATLWDFVEMYEAAASGDLQKYAQARNEAGYGSPEEGRDLAADANMWLATIKENFFGDAFFARVFVKDVISGQIADLKPYSKLPIATAEDKYDKKRVFKDVTPVRQYDNGWKWINVGPRCQLIGGKMKNCGSTGVMSLDPDRTMMTLFDKGDKPHVVVTYSPNDKRVSGDEGVGGTPVKDAYGDYVLDLAKTLGARFDFDKSKSPMLSLKGAVGSENVRAITPVDGSTYYFRVDLNNGKTWYTNRYTYVPEEDITKMMPEYENDFTKTLVGVFHNDSRSLFDRKIVRYIPAAFFQRDGLS